jgi:sigma-B regulation protein RsbU (phosphoserine phosphatase)
VIGTDGIWESRNSKGEMFGKDKLKEVIRENAGESAKGILNSVIKEVEQFSHPLKKEDDVTLTVIKIEQ